MFTCNYLALLIVTLNGGESRLSSSFCLHCKIRVFYTAFKYQRWAFASKQDIFRSENDMVSSHVKRSPLLWLHNKSLWNGLAFYWLYNNRTLHMHGPLEIPNLSPSVEKDSKEKRYFVYPQPCHILFFYVISSILYPLFTPWQLSCQG